MQLSYSQLEVILTAHFQIHPDKVGTFRARLKQLQRLSFPPGVNVGRGTKMAYGAEHLFQLVTVLELIHIGLPAATAATIVTKHWPHFAAAYAWAQASIYRNQLRDRFYARVLHSSFKEFRSENEISDGVYVENKESLLRVLDINSSRSMYCYPVICVSDVFQSVTEAAEKIARVQVLSWLDEVNGWFVRRSADTHWLFPYLPMDRVPGKIPGE
ncbi:hypothetical protein WBP07_13030 [Novosphingobium sp. BL-8A]|uniref:hypothetical protein n=1 Tax=Novosphingobium sp. BL-8A TaxID=3127639 RepID=UPI0037570796